MKQNKHIVKITTVETEEFLSIYNANRRVNELHDLVTKREKTKVGHKEVTIELIEMEKKVA